MSNDPHIEGRRLIDLMAERWRTNGMNPGHLGHAALALDQILFDAGPDKWQAVLTRMYAAWGEWLAYWKHYGIGVRYRPTIANWLSGGHWQGAPAIVADPVPAAGEAKESASARALRLMREAQ